MDKAAARDEPIRLLIDGLAAAHGGLGTYLRGLLGGWAQCAPEDRLTVLATGALGQDLATKYTSPRWRFRLFSSRNPRELWRLAQTKLILPGYQREVEALLATMPTVPLLWRKAIITVVHDLRHDYRPEEFSLRQQVARRTFYTQAFRRSNRLVAISQRVADDLADRYPFTAPRISVVRHGSDHVAAWSSARSGDAMAFGHSANKDVLLILGTWKHLLERSGSLPILHVVGLDKSNRASLAREAIRLGIQDNVMLDAYLPAHQFQQLMSSASVVLFPSRHEGFGLPVLEAIARASPLSSPLTGPCTRSPAAMRRKLLDGHRTSSAWRFGVLCT